MQRQRRRERRALVRQVNLIKPKPPRSIFIQKGKAGRGSGQMRTSAWRLELQRGCSAPALAPAGTIDAAIDASSGYYVQPGGGGGAPAFLRSGALLTPTPGPSRWRALHPWLVAQVWLNGFILLLVHMFHPYVLRRGGKAPKQTPLLYFRFRSKCITAPPHDNCVPEGRTDINT